MEQGKKIFLLRPHSVIRDEMLDVLIMAGFETYTVLDEKKALNLLAKFPDSIMFINIDEGLKEFEWEVYIRKIMDDPRTKNCRLGIMSYNQDMQLMKKYLMNISVPCGYIHLKLGLKESTQIILAALEANEARGRRKYVRANCEDDPGALLNIKIDKKMLRGKILDISSSGIAARFDRSLGLPLHSKIEDVQLRLRSSLVMTDMIFIGQRHGDSSVSIMLFGSVLRPDSALAVHRYIKQCLQKYINKLKF
jgi:hypothetical protein